MTTVVLNPFDQPIKSLFRHHLVDLQQNSFIYAGGKSRQE